MDSHTSASLINPMLEVSSIWHISVTDDDIKELEESLFKYKQANPYGDDNNFGFEVILIFWWN